MKGLKGEELIVVVIIFGIGFIIVFGLWKILMRILVKLKWTEKHMIQHEINKLAAGTDEERYHALGKSSRDAVEKGGFRGWFWLLIILVIIGLLLYSVFSK